MHFIPNALTLLLLLNLTPALANEYDANALTNSIFARAACGAIPCSGNATCANYGCGGCKGDYCMETAKEEAAASSAAAAAASAAATAMPAAASMSAANAAARMNAACGVVVAAGVVAALL